MSTIKVCKAIYIESGTFIAGEENVFKIGIKHDEEVYIVRKKDFREIKKMFENRRG